jgi:Ribonuclease G/E
LGRVKTPETVALEIRRAVLRSAANREATEFAVRAHPEVVHLLAGELRGIVEELRDRHGLVIRLIEMPEFNPARFDVSG